VIDIVIRLIDFDIDARGKQKELDQHRELLSREAARIASLAGFTPFGSNPLQSRASVIAVE